MSNRVDRSRGFTLVEVVAALGAFSIAFLAGFAAIGSLMIRQDINYRATIAASAAMMFIQKGDVSGATATTNATAFMASWAKPAGTIFRGYPVTDEAAILAAANIHTFKTSGTTPANMTEYRPILMTPIAGKMVFWYGAPEEIEANRAATLDYLGGYAYAP